MFKRILVGKVSDGSTKRRHLESDVVLGIVRLPKAIGTPMIVGKPTSSSDRLIILGSGCAPIPERLLLAHARGRVLFITGAGISRPAGLPDFRGLVRQTYAEVDPAIHGVLGSPVSATSKYPDCSSLRAEQAAEVRRFFSGDYDVALGMLERRMDTDPSKSRMRAAVEKILRAPASKPKAIHRALMLLAD